MHDRWHGLVGVVAIALITGCAAPGRRAAGEQGTRPPGDSAGPPQGAVVLDREALSQAPGPLLEVMVQEFTSMEVLRARETTADCPLIALRGPVTGTSLSNPLVYVDGTRSSGTCILRSLDSGAVARVEVYPTGHTKRPGYATHPHGLILVFMRFR